MVRTKTEKTIYIDLDDQSLRVESSTEMLYRTQISSAKNGPGERHGSEQTPRGWHTVRAKIGADHAENSVFVGRRFSGEVYSQSLAQAQPKRDWILTRILWLSGLEPGINRLGEVDTMRRYIYIHGCPDNAAMGEAISHGCIRMRNMDVMALFDMVDVGTQVLITE